MQIDFEKKERFLIVNIEGKLDSITSLEAEQKLNSALNSAQKRIILNFEKLDYISSAGLRILLILSKKAKSSQIEIVFTGFKPKILDVFKVSGLTKIFNIKSSLTEAENYFE